MVTGLFLFQNDLRLHDNPALKLAAQEVDNMICVYCLPGNRRDRMPYSVSQLGRCRQQFLMQSLRNLNNQLGRFHQHLQVIEAVLEAYQDSENQIDIAQVEGFIRQILGWREYIRGIYWGNMPHYRELNALDVHRHLPEFFWTGKTKMACMKAAIDQSLDYAYAHHIQRLMVTGNFCLLAEIHPDEVDTWYLGIYIDAIEWVEMPNTRGMTLYADNGIVATKPYAASGNYINKMSDYCKDCHYNVRQKTGEKACPFNSLYWRFLHVHERKLNSLISVIVISIGITGI